MSGTDNVKTAARNGLFAQIKLDKSSSVYGKAIDWFCKKWQEARGRLELGQDAEEDAPFFLFVLSSCETPSSAAVLDLAERFAKAQDGADDAGNESDSLEFDDAPAGEPAPAAAATPGELLLPPQPDSSTPPAAQPDSSPPSDPLPVPLPAKKSFVAPAQKAVVPPPVSASKGKGKTGVVKGKSDNKKEGKKKDASKKETTSKSKKRDPNAPKKAPSSYILYTSQSRAAYIANNPGSSNKEIMSGLGAQWSALSEEDKRPFADEAAEAKRRQDPLIAEYRLANPDSNPSTPRSKKTKAGDDGSRRKSAKKAKKASSGFEDGQDGQDGQDDEDEDSGGGEGQPSSVAKTKARRAAALAMSYDNENIEEDEEDDMAEMEVATLPPLAAKTKKAAQGSTSSSTTASKKKKPSETFRAPSDSASRGIKQEDLVSDDDLLNTAMVPFVLSAFPPDEAVAKENEIVVILTPYRSFVSTQQQLLAQHERDLVQQICVYTSAFVVGTVKSIQKASASATPSGDSDADSDADSLNLVTIATRQGRVFTILHCDYTSPLLTGDRFVIPKGVFDSSIKAVWLEIGSPVRRMFAVEEGGEGGEDEQGQQAEWLEGIVYHTSQDLAANPYNAISVIWTGQEQGTNEWIYLYNQSSNECSPWDLEASRFKRFDHKYKPFDLPNCMKGAGPLSAQTILDFLTGHDAAPLFNLSMSDLSSEWRQMFPDKKDWLDLKVLNKNVDRGRYEGDVGITTLFRDLELMVANGKRFNATNKAFLVWRQIDVFEKAVILVKRKVAANHNIASLRESVHDQMKMELELDMESREV